MKLFKFFRNLFKKKKCADCKPETCCKNEK